MEEEGEDPRARIPQGGHLQIKTGRTTDRLKQIASPETW